MKRTTWTTWTTRTTVSAIALICAAMAAVGCSNKHNDPQMSAAPGGSNFSVAPAPQAMEVAPAPLAPPAVVEAPAPIAEPVAAAPAGGGNYTVQRGDTLWKIATNSYGDGKQWQKIAAANPGLSPQTLKAGQTIMIP